MEAGSIILVTGLAIGVGMGVVAYKVTHRHKVVHPHKYPRPNNNMPTPKQKEKTLPPEFSDSEISAILNCMKKLDVIYKKM